MVIMQSKYPNNGGEFFILPLGVTVLFIHIKYEFRVQNISP